MNEVTTVIVEALLKSLVLALVLLTGFAYMTLAERKVVAWMQVRIGPNRAGPLGLLQPLADGIKLLLKEELTPAGADKVMFILAPVITVVPALIILAVVPIAPDLPMFGRMIRMSISDLNTGTLYILAIAAIAVYGIVLAGWASNSKYAMMGGLRSTAQMISYELALGMSFIGPVLLSSSLSIHDIVKAQHDVWYVWLQPVGALIFGITVLAETNRAPFDMPEAEQELTAGYHTEYSGMKFALFFMAEYIKMIAVCAIGVSLFLGGYWGPFVDQFPALGIVYFSLKTAFFLFTMIWIRATLPRLRYDQLMDFGWKVMLPLALANVVITAVVVVLTQK